MLAASCGHVMVPATAIVNPMLIQSFTNYNRLTRGYVTSAPVGAT
jgi:hypothetical protein